MTLLNYLRHIIGTSTAINTFSLHLLWKFSGLSFHGVHLHIQSAQYPIQFKRGKNNAQFQSQHKSYLYANIRYQSDIPIQKQQKKYHILYQRLSKVRYNSKNVFLHI